MVENIEANGLEGQVPEGFDEAKEVLFLLVERGDLLKVEGLTRSLLLMNSFQVSLFFYLGILQTSVPINPETVLFRPLRAHHVPIVAFISHRSHWTIRSIITKLGPPQIIFPRHISTLRITLVLPFSILPTIRGVSRHPAQFAFSFLPLPRIRASEKNIDSQNMTLNLFHFYWIFSTLFHCWFRHVFSFSYLRFGFYFHFKPHWSDFQLIDRPIHLLPKFFE